MKKTLLVAFVTTMAISAHADEYREMCNSLSGAARKTMERRQEGVSMQKLMEIAKGNELIEGIIISAYDSPRYSTKEMQARSVEDFRDKWYLECIKKQRDK
jgi:hypothetical protein